MLKLKIIVGTILILFSIDAVLVKYGHVSMKRIGKVIMDKTYVITKVLILWVEHIALILFGILGGLWLAKKRSKNNNTSQPILSKEEVKSIIRTENLAPVAEAKEIVEPVKPKEIICPEWGEKFVKAIGQVWLEKNFGTSTSR